MASLPMVSKRHRTVVKTSSRLSLWRNRNDSSRLSTPPLHTSQNPRHIPDIDCDGSSDRTDRLAKYLSNQRYSKQHKNLVSDLDWAPIKAPIAERVRPR